MSQFSNSSNKSNNNRYNNNGQRERKSGGQRTGSGNSDGYRYNQNQPPRTGSYNNSQPQRPVNDGKQHSKVDPRVSSLKAECMQMCSQEERQMRIYNKLVNPLEIKRTADSRTEYVLVKEYSRPAAGKVVKSTDLRPISVLAETTDYLVKEIFAKREENQLQVYEFLFDRFRSIRQDLTIQRLNASDPRTLSILKTILKFYLISDYRLCHHQGYDAFINSQHLNEVLNSIVAHLGSDSKATFAASGEDYNAVFLCVFLLINVNNWININNLIKVRWLRDNSVYRKCLELARNYIQHNYVRVLRIYESLPLLCQLAFHPRIPSIHIELFKRYNAAFSFKNSKYPVDTLVNLTLLNHKISLEKYVRAGLLSFDEERENITFAKTNSGSSVKEEREQLKVIDDKLESVDQVDFLLNDYEV